MAKPKQGNGLDLDVDMNFQEKEWRVERIGWIIMALLALAGLLGLFGEGPLANARAVNGPIVVEYERFERLLSPAKLRAQVAPEAVQNEEVRLYVTRTILDSLEVLDISPQPDSMVLTPDGVVYVFKVKDPSAPMRIRFDMETARAGSNSGQIGIENGAMVEIRQFIYP